MTEQWFLDLDGVRSGPYQTPEVLSLIAEGEVLPHHRISRTLKDSAWVTILDWRLEQARHTPAPEPRPAPPPPAPEVRSVEFKLPEPEPTPEPEPEPVAPPPLTLQAVVPPPSEEPVVERTMKLEPVTPETPPESARPVDAPRSKRDPTAELFDIIQTSKQKREVRQQHQAQIQAELDRSQVPAQEGGWVKVMLIGAGLALIGFSVGQMFQQSAQPPAEPKVARETPAPPAVSASASPTESVQVMDRSTDKMTIKAVVPAAPKPVAKAQPKTAQNTPPPPPREEPREDDREMQELKDLKKELQELKAMKDQLRDNTAIEEFDEEGRAPYPGEGSPTFPEPETISPGGPSGDGSGRKYRMPPNASPPPDSYY